MKFKYNKINININLDKNHIPLIKWASKNQNFREEPFLRFLKDNKIINKESTVLDVGSYIGNHVIYYSKIIKVKKVIAFEPTIRSFNILQENIKNNNIKNVEYNNLAVSSKIGFAECNIRKKRNPAANQWYNVDNLTINCVQTITLSEFIKEKVDFIKIDVEGMELKVLSGGEELIKKYSPYLMVEVMKENLNDFLLIMKKWKYNRIGKSVFTLNKDFKLNTLLYKRK